MAIWIPAAGMAAKEIAKRGAKGYLKRKAKESAAKGTGFGASMAGAKAAHDLPERKARTRDPIASRSRTSLQRDR